jgi:hypothetical protein
MLLFPTVFTQFYDRLDHICLSTLILLTTTCINDQKLARNRQADLNLNLKFRNFSFQIAGKPWIEIS